MEAVFSVFTPTTLVLIVWVTAMATLHYIFIRKQKTRGFSKNSEEDIKNNNIPAEPVAAPGPRPLPIIGNLHHLAKYEKNPYSGFTEMAEEYGSVYSLQMGTTPALVVSSSEGLKEVLITKGAKFDGRPDFHRWNLYFDGDRQQCKFQDY